MRDFLKKILVRLLRWEAQAVLRKYNPKIVAVTGSVGKTSTKDAIYTVLATSTHVRKSEKSFNSEFGLPLTILGRPNAWDNPLRWAANLIDGLLLALFDAHYPEWLVLEVGADRPGDIRSLVPWLKTDVVVITRLPEVPVHVEFFDSVEDVVEEKASLIDTLRPGGALLLYADDARTLKLQERLPAPDARIITFGFSPEAQVRARDVTFIYETKEGARAQPIGVKATLDIGDAQMPVSIIGVLGAHAFLPAVAAAAVGVALAIDPAEIVRGIGAYEPAPGRMRLIPGIKGSLIIDDTYNASPAAVGAALDVLEVLRPHGRTIAVLGDMLELGRVSVEEHRKIGVQCARAADVLLTVGFRARDIAQAALDSGLPEGNIFQYEDSAKAGAELQNILREGDTVLVKGSQSTRMERVVEEVMAEPERASDLLVRQDAEWKRR